MKKSIVLFTILLTILGSCKKDDVNKNSKSCYTCMNTQLIGHDGIISEISSQYNVDIEKIYAAGYSNGGLMAYGLANYKTDLIATVAPVSGAMLDWKGPASHFMPTVHLHRTSDGVLLYNGDNYYSSAQSTLDYWIDFHNTLINPTASSSSNNGGMPIEHYVYDQVDSAVSVEHWKYIRGDRV
jgi:polyhydroxybutyrate depolymerase